LAASAKLQSSDKTVEIIAIKNDVPQVKQVILNSEELDETLADADYDDIPEPIDCSIRVFGQTEVCESIAGPKRSDSRWMTTVLNGFLRDIKSGEEIPFRTANQTMPHLDQF
jgi:hypothetical protein